MSNFAAGRPVDKGPSEKVFGDPFFTLFRQSVRVICGCGWEGLPVDFGWHRFQSIAGLHFDDTAWMKADREHSLMRFVHVIETPLVEAPKT